MADVTIYVTNRTTRCLAGLAAGGAWALEAPGGRADSIAPNVLFRVSALLLSGLSDVLVTADVVETDGHEFVPVAAAWPSEADLTATRPPFAPVQGIPGLAVPELRGPLEIDVFSEDGSRGPLSDPLRVSVDVALLLRPAAGASLFIDTRSDHYSTRDHPVAPLDLVMSVDARTVDRHTRDLRRRTLELLSD